MLLLGCNTANSYSWFDFPYCSECPATLNDVGDGIRLMMKSAHVAVTKVCRLNRSTARNCMATAKVVEDVINEITTELFPQEYQNVSRGVMCAHALRICPDTTSGGKELTDGKWSCESCFSFYDKLFTLISKPLEKINQALPLFLCDNGQRNCKDAFSSAIQLTGALNDILHKKTTTDYACNTLMSCVAY